MIGPHEGRELELMLTGEKHLALFYDAVSEPFINNDNIIPEEDFAPYVAKGIFNRHQQDFFHIKQNKYVRYVCFTTPNNAWRAHAFYWAHSECLSGLRKFDQHYEFFVGRMLGYNDEDIKEYVSQFNF